MNDKIEALEKQIFSMREKLRELRQNAPHETVEDYPFTRADGSGVKLSELFDGKDDLLVIHNMGKSCVYCTMWADGLNGLAGHLSDRAGFVLASPDEPDVQKEFASSRGWTYPTVSAQGTSFFNDMGFESEGGKPWPGVSAFHKNENGTIVRTGKAFFGPGDEFNGAWHLFDLLPGGAGDWQPKYTY